MKLKQYDSATATWRTIAQGSGGNGSGTFIGLTDVPAAYAGSGSKFVAVNSGASALEFVAAPTGGLTTGYHATPSATVTVATSTTTLIPMDTVTFDINSEDDDANNRWLCKTTGKYLIMAQCYFATGSTGYRNVNIYKNATTTGTPAVLSTGTRLGIGNVSDAAEPDYPIVVCVAALTAGDYLEVFVRHSQGSDVVCGGVTYPVSWISVVRIN